MPDPGARPRMRHPEPPGVTVAGGAGYCEGFAATVRTVALRMPRRRSWATFALMRPRVNLVSRRFVDYRRVASQMCRGTDVRMRAA